MDNTGIISFSLESLGKIEGFTEPGDHAYKGCFFAHRDSASGSKMQIFKYPCRINAYIAVLCTEGSAEVISNMKILKIRKNCLFVSMPNDIIQLLSWNDCEFFIIALNDDFVRQILVDYKNIVSVFLTLQKSPCIEISQEETDSLEETFRYLLRDMRLFGESVYYNEIVLNYISLVAYKASSVINKHLESDNVKAVTQRKEEYYSKFMALLNDNFKHERNIGYYASQLYITPKYLASLIKKMSGRSATQWINEYVVMEAKHLLKYSKMSIQEISDYLTFPNQSFFAQYFKRQAGMTPTEYRRTI